MELWLVINEDGDFNVGGSNITCLRRGIETIDRGDCEPKRGILL